MTSSNSCACDLFCAGEEGVSDDHSNIDQDDTDHGDMDQSDMDDSDMDHGNMAIGRYGSDTTRKN